MKNEGARQFNLKRWKDPEYRALMSEVRRRENLKLWADPEYRKKMSAVTKRTNARHNLPPWGTPERKQYEKDRKILGLEAARAALKARSG